MTNPVSQALLEIASNIEKFEKLKKRDKNFDVKGDITTYLTDLKKAVIPFPKQGDFSAMLYVQVYIDEIVNDPKFSNMSSKDIIAKFREKAELFHSILSDPNKKNDLDALTEIVKTRKFTFEEMISSDLFSDDISLPDVPQQIRDREELHKGFTINKNKDLKTLNKYKDKISAIVEKHENFLAENNLSPSLLKIYEMEFSGAFYAYKNAKPENKNFASIINKIEWCIEGGLEESKEKELKNIQKLFRKAQKELIEANEREGEVALGRKKVSWVKE